MKFTIFYKKYESPIAWGVTENDKVIGYLKMTFNLSNVSFAIETPNFSTCFRNPLKAIQAALEHEGVGMQKYTALKDRLRFSGMWKQL